MAGEMGKPDYQEQDRAYMEGAARPLDQFGSVLMTNSRFLNSAKMRDVYAQEGLRKDGRDVPPTYMVHQAAMAIGELTDVPEVERLIAAEKAKNPEFAAWLDHIAHQPSEYFVRHIGLINCHAQHRAIGRVERGFPQLFRIHLPQSLVALDRQSLAAGRQDRIEQLRRPGDQ